MISPYSIEQAYAFFHQKERIYSQSSSPRQRDDIEYAISQYLEQMSPDLYQWLAQGRSGFLYDHATFAADIREAVERLEAQL